MILDLGNYIVDGDAIEAVEYKADLVVLYLTNKAVPLDRNDDATMIALDRWLTAKKKAVGVIAE